MQAIFRRKKNKTTVLVGFLIGFTVVQVLHPNFLGDWPSYMFSIGKFNYLFFHETTPIYSKSILDTLDLDCDAMWKRKNESKMNELKNWMFDYKMPELQSFYSNNIKINPLIELKYDYNMLEFQLIYSNNTCESIHKFFDFPPKPYSQEEEEYPLSYGILVYKNYVQKESICSKLARRIIQRQMQAIFRRKKNKTTVLVGFLIGFTVVQVLHPNFLGKMNELKNWMFDYKMPELQSFYSNNIKINPLIELKYDYNMLEFQLIYSNNTCESIHKFFDFPPKPYSQEEEEYPLSYGILVYKNYVQLMFMLSSIYQPQNAYCIAVSESATNEFKQLIIFTQQCLPNINVMFRPAISWGSFEIINSVYKCMESLTQLNNNWKYFQYLSGFDVPLKTNLEMVKIFKTLNESINFEIMPFQDERYMTRKKEEAPIKLYKSSLSALIPRSAANFLVLANLTKNLMEYLSETGIPDESLWGTVSGNTKDFPVPGSIDAESFLTNQLLFNKTNNISKKKSHFGYYISRYQVWDDGVGLCYGRWKSASCVYGVGDYERLIQQPHLIAHKMYIDSEPAAYFCVLKEIRNRTLNPVAFDVTPYSELPQVELKKGVPYKKLKRPDWILHMNGEL